MLPILLLAQSQPPSPTPAKPTQKSKGTATDKQVEVSSIQGDANSLSAAVDKLTSEIASWKKQESAKQDKTDTSAERWAIGSAAVSATATIAIAILAFFQWRSMDKQRLAMDMQAKYMSDGLIETRRAVDAAKASADTAVLQRDVMDKQARFMEEGLKETRVAAQAASDSASAALRSFAAAHRPKLAVRFVAMPHSVNTFQMFGDFRLINTGETKAFVTKVYSEIIISPTLPPMKSNLEFKETAEKISGEIESGQFKLIAFPTNSPRQLEVSERNAIANRREDIMQRHIEQRGANIYLIGWIEYTDETNRLRKLGFCRKYNFVTDRFDKETDQDYEYDD